MATIVRNDQNGKQYILIGAGFGSSKVNRPNPLISSVAPISSDQIETIAVCDRNGDIYFFPAIQLTVVLVDGNPCSDLLDSAQGG